MTPKIINKSKYNNPDVVNVVVVTNTPAPYRIPVFDLIKNFKLTVIYSARLESNRRWSIGNLNHEHIFLNENSKALRDGYNFIHNNADIWQHLNRIQPALVITTGFNPTQIYAYVWAILHRSRHICMTDGTIGSEADLSVLHRMARRFFFVGSSSYIAASKSGVDLYRSYGIQEKKIFRSQLCANNDHFINANNQKDRRYDVIFSGQFHERKLPFLFVDVCKKIALRRGNCRALLIGDGPLRGEVINRLKQTEVDFHYAGFVQQNDLPKYYGDARILLFTTRKDAWGVVANEAMAAGTPVITTPYAGVAGELVIDGVTGAVCEPDPEIWTRAAIRLLDDPRHWSACSLNARKLVEGYNYKVAAEGIEAACRFALEQE